MQKMIIDKTGSLEKGIVAFPSIYIEGAAASGKTTAVQMLISKHSDVKAIVLQMDKEILDFGEFREKLSEIRSQMEKEAIWVVFENFPGSLEAGCAAVLTEFVHQLPEKCRVIFVSRERPQEEFLKLLWKRKMEIIPMEALLFAKEEIRDLAEHTGVALNPDDIYTETGGWAGCVDLMLRLAVRDAEYGKSREGVAELLDSYEISRFIRRELLDTLSPEEQDMLVRSCACPWLDAVLCEEVWGMASASDVLNRLERKGLLLHERKKNRWKTAPLFQKSVLHNDRGQELGDKEKLPDELQFWKSLGKWYESKGCVSEALRCLKRSGDENAYRSCLINHYEVIPFLNVSYDEVMEWKEKSPEISYLRGMYCYAHQNLEGLDREIRNLEKTKGDKRRIREIILNLTYVKPDLSLDIWLEELEKNAREYGKFQLYGMLGNSLTFLCGLRDLSGLFACTKKEENRKARIWKECLGDTEWRCYQLARMDYYLETERGNALREEDQDFLMQKNTGEEPWQTQLARMYLLCKMQRIHPDEEYVERIHFLENILLQEENESCVRMAEALSCLYSPWYQERERLSRWLRYAVMDSTVTVDEENYMMFCCRAKGYLLLNQYERAEKILRKLLPYLQFYHRSRFLAEMLFQQAMVNFGRYVHGQAVRYAVESFLVTGSSRYVGFYTGYGEKGRIVLEAYVEWLRSSTPEEWHRKKKYNYGNVLRMPMEDYMEVILRCAKKRSSSAQPFPEEYIEERLTMMETIILQDIGRGLTNAEICRELGLKLPTVKSHIYSLYKKLGVNSRMQAVIKGKEFGILE